jgi:Na+-transporting NADH:ubiquinone oxidoreductase subunit NqrF
MTSSSPAKLPTTTWNSQLAFGDDWDHYGLFDQIATEMNAVARPGIAWKKTNWSRAHIPALALGPR